MSILADGKKIALGLRDVIQQQISDSGQVPKFGIVYVGSDPVVDNFLRYKQEFGAAVGANVVVHRFPDDVSAVELKSSICQIAEGIDGMIVQLPLPQHLPTQEILDSIPASKDIDVLGSSARSSFSRGDTELIPPVTGSIIEILRVSGVELSDKKIVLFGNGSLVGYPFSLWLRRNSIEHEVIDKDTDMQIRNELLASADIIVSGVGQPHILTSDLVADGVALIDAGTSESGKKIIGDIHPDCYSKSSLFTPVPGGIGPITIAVLYQNLLRACLEKND